MPPSGECLHHIAPAATMVNKVVETHSINRVNSGVNLHPPGVDCGEAYCPMLTILHFPPDFAPLRLRQD
jgi:hypothetical protein